MLQSMEIVAALEEVLCNLHEAVSLASPIGLKGAEKASRSVPNCFGMLGNALEYTEIF